MSWTTNVPSSILATCYSGGTPTVTPTVTFRLSAGTPPPPQNPIYTDVEGYFGPGGCSQCRVIAILNAYFTTPFGDTWFWYRCKIYRNMDSCDGSSGAISFDPWRYGDSGYAGAPGSDGDCAASILAWLNSLSLGGQVYFRACDCPFFDGTPISTNTPDISTKVASRFRVGAACYLKSIQLRTPWWPAPTAWTPRLSVWSDDASPSTGPIPSSSLHTLATPALPVENPVFTSAGYSLAANTYYWAVLDVVVTGSGYGAYYSWYFTDYDSSCVSSLPYCDDWWADYSYGYWASSKGGPYAMKTVVSFT